MNSRTKKSFKISAQGNSFGPTNLEFLVHGLEVGVLLDRPLGVTLEVGQPRFEAQVFGLQFFDLVLELFNIARQLIPLNLENSVGAVLKSVFVIAISISNIIPLTSTHSVQSSLRLSIRHLHDRLDS